MTNVTIPDTMTDTIPDPITIIIWIYPIHRMRDIILLSHLLQNIARIAKRYIELDIMKL